MDSLKIAATASDTSHPRQGLQAVVSLRKLVDSLELSQVEAALREGMSWSEIAQHLGVSRQAVHKKYRYSIDPSIKIPHRGTQ